jgi:hypothetical protein
MVRFHPDPTPAFIVGSYRQLTAPVPGICRTDALAGLVGL